MTAAIDARIAVAAALTAQWWPHIAATSTDSRIRGSFLETIECRTDRPSRDADRNHMLDAVARIGQWETPISLRVQSGPYIQYATITLRDTEVRRVVVGDCWAELLVQLYATDDQLHRYVIADLTKLRGHLETVNDNDRRWKLVKVGTPAWMLHVNVATLSDHGALVDHWPFGGHVMSIESGEDADGVAADATPSVVGSTVPAVPDDNGKTPVARHYNDLWKLATLTTSTQMVPKSLRGRPEEAFAVMVYGSELGIAPMAALRSIYIIEGQPTCSAQLMRGLIQAAGHILSWRKVTPDRVELYGRRRDNGSDATVVWTLDDAKRAKLVGKGNWATYPRSMLAARATSELARLLFADILHGLNYTPEELGAVGPMAAIDIEYDPARDGKVVDRETGEILDPEPAITGSGNTAGNPDIGSSADDDIEDAEWVQQALEEPDGG